MKAKLNTYEILFRVVNPTDQQAPPAEAREFVVHWVDLNKNVALERAKKNHEASEGCALEAVEIKCINARK